MERVVTFREFVRSLEPKLKQYGSCTVDNVYNTLGETGVAYYSLDLIDRNGKIRKVNVKAVRG